jgi:hypothetical protein
MPYSERFILSTESEYRIAGADGIPDEGYSRNGDPELRDTFMK